MSKIAVITDTNSSMPQEEAQKLGVFLIPMPIVVSETEYFEGVSITYEHFFDKLAAGEEVSTSQPSPEYVTSLWEEILKTYDSIIHIPMSSALSGSCGTAKTLALDYPGRVFVVDNKRISISQRASVLDALTLIQHGKEAAEIQKILEETAFDSSIYLAVNTLELLKKSGRVTAAGAAVATVLGIKPVLQIQGEKLDAFAKARGMKKAETIMLEAMKKDLDTRFAGKPVTLQAAYSGDLESAEVWLREMKDYFGTEDIQMYRLPLSICCHVGAGVHALGCMQIIEP